MQLELVLTEIVFKIFHKIFTLNVLLLHYFNHALNMARMLINTRSTAV